MPARRRRVGWIAACGAFVIAGVVYLGLGSADTEPASVAPASPASRRPHPEPQAPDPPPRGISEVRMRGLGVPRPAESPAPVSLERTLAGSEELPRALIRSLLQGAFESYLPRHKLSSDEYEQLTDAVIRIRAARRGMAELTLSVENAERLRGLLEMLVDALSDFEYVADMSPAEFTERIQPGVGITADSDEDASDEDVALEYLQDRATRE